MFREEFKRLIKSKMSIVILILLIASAVSFFISYNDKQMFVEQLNSDFSNDLNRVALSELISDYTGLRFLFNFWFESDFSQILMFILYVWAGIFLSPVLGEQRENGFGNMMMIRKNYKQVALNIFKAQSLYICVIIFCTTVLQVLLAFLFGGFGTTVSIGEYQLNSMSVILLIFLQMAIMAFYTVMANGIALVSSTIIKNKYLIQAFPLLVFALIPSILSPTVGNLSTVFASGIIYFEPGIVFNIIPNILHSSFNGMEIFCNVIPSIIYVIVLACLFVTDIRRNSRNYV